MQSSPNPDSPCPPWPTFGQQERLTACLARLVAMGTGSRPHAVSTFYEHLLGTWRILTVWGLPEFVCVAGLFHSIYGSQTMDRHGTSKEVRAELLRLVGHEAERLVFLFSIIERRGLYDSLVDFRRLPSRLSVPVRVSTGLWSKAMTAHDVANLIAIDIANLAEQSHAGDLSPDIWMWKAARVARLLWHSGLAITPLAKWSLSEEAEISARKDYLSGLQCMADRPAEAERLFEVSAQANRFVGEPIFALAYLSYRNRDYRGARAYARQGLYRLGRLATAWDKRLSLEAWIAFGNALRDRST
jgi:hypothetical protein